MCPQRSGAADVSHVLQKEAVLLVCDLEKGGMCDPAWRVLLLWGQVSSSSRAGLARAGQEAPGPMV